MRRCRGVGASARRDEELPAHAEVAQDGIAVSRAAARGTCRAARHRRRVSALEPVRRSRPGRGGDGAPTGRRAPSTAVIVRPTTWSTMPSRTTSTSGSSGTVRRWRSRRPALEVGVDARHAISATICSASFLERPVPPSYVRSPTTHLGGEVLSWSGPVPDEDVVRARRGRCWPRSPAGDVFQSRPGTELGGDGDHRVEDAVDDLGGPLDAELHVDGAEHRLDGVGQDRGLVATAGRLLASAEAHVVAEPERARDLGERLGADDGGAQLGELALGQVGVTREQRVGDDEAQHRVAEELEALVVGDPAVLVRERAVRQGMLKELRVEVLDSQDLPQPLSVGCTQRSEDLAALAASSVLTALGARVVRLHLGVARGVGAVDDRRRGGLPLRTTVTRVAARHLPLRNGHDLLLAVVGRDVRL